MKKQFSIAAAQGVVAKQDNSVSTANVSNLTIGAISRLFSKKTHLFLLLALTSFFKIDAICQNHDTLNVVNY
ncbi:MAG: hypothetical protein AAF570_07475, partial [Bacteroidota bacterium]